MEKNNVLICVVMLLISCVVNTSKWAGALPGSPGRLGSHVVVSELQLSATPQPLAGRPLLASDHSTFFLFFPPFVPCFLCLFCKTHAACKEKTAVASGRKGAGRARGVPTRFLSDRETISAPAQDLPAVPGEGPAPTPPP